jgi:hypothetical protein
MTSHDRVTRLDENGIVEAKRSNVFKRQPVSQSPTLTILGRSTTNQRMPVLSHRS